MIVDESILQDEERCLENKIWLGLCIDIHDRPRVVGATGKFRQHGVWKLE